jgi:hypothetical protein
VLVNWLIANSLTQREGPKNFFLFFLKYFRNFQFQRAIL